MRTFQIKTFGCKVNQYDSQSIREQMISAGFREISVGEIPAIIIVNTCCVTDKAEKKARQFLNSFKKKYPNTFVAVTGCSVNYKPENYSQENYTFSNTQKSSFAKMFGGKTADNFSSLKDFSGRTRAFVKIQDGCDLFCSYCIVPYVRGSSKCRDLSEILDEIRRFVSVGYKEIVLTGVHIGNHEGLSTILKEAETIPELLRVRISSIEPQEMTEELLAIFSSLKKLCRHFHIPLQSGSDEVLKKMNRRYTYGEYKKIISRINCRLPDVTLTTDIIVGFPGETKEDFDKTCRAVNDIGFVKVHIFPYSRRLGTKAAGFSDQIAQLEIKRRAKVLQNIADGTAETIKKIFVGTTQEVLIESAGKKFNGYTKGYLPVRVNNKGSNEIVKVLITGLDGQYLLG